MTRQAFFDAIRPMFSRGLSSVQVQVIDAILDQTADWPRDHVAYVLATAYGEAQLTPKRENMNYTAARIKAVWPSRPEAVKFAGQPVSLANSVYGDRLGNRRGTNDGWTYRGGGIDQLTGRDNYRKVGIAATPEAILQPDTAVSSILHGMETGRYTGKKLSDYDSPSGFNFTAARAIINGDVKANGAKYAGYARKFAAAIALIETPPPVDHVPVNKPSKPNLWAGITAALAAIFRRK